MSPIGLQYIYGKHNPSPAASTPTFATKISMDIFGVRAADGTISRPNKYGYIYLSERNLMDHSQSISRYIDPEATSLRPVQSIVADRKLRSLNDNRRGNWIRIGGTIGLIDESVSLILRLKLSVTLNRRPYRDAAVFCELGGLQAGTHDLVSISSTIGGYHPDCTLSDMSSEADSNLVPVFTGKAKLYSYAIDPYEFKQIFRNHINKAEIETLMDPEEFEELVSIEVLKKTKRPKEARMETKVSTRKGERTIIRSRRVRKLSL